MKQEQEQNTSTPPVACPMCAGHNMGSPMQPFRMRAGKTLCAFGVDIFQHTPTPHTPHKA